MSYNGSGVFVINSTGQPVVSGTVISSTVFNSLTSDLATGLSTAITTDGQSATTARIPFAAGIDSSLTTDATSIATGSVITAGGVGIAKALWVGGLANIAGVLTTIAQVITSASANAFAVGRVGTTNPAFNIDASTALSATGVNIKSAAAAGGVAVSVLSSGANEALTVNAKGSGTIGIGSVSTGAVTITPATTISGAATLSSTLGVTGAATLSSTLGVTGATTLSSTLGVTGATTLSSTLGVTGATTLSSTLGVTGVATFAAGSAAAPAITTSGDTNTGIFFPAADTIAFGEGGAEAVRIDSSGNVGIGTASPGSKLAVLGSDGTGFTGLTLTNSNGNVGIAGVQFSSDTTYVKAAIGLLRSSPNGVGSLVFYNDSNTDAANWATTDEKMRLDSSGNVGIGTASPGAKLDINAGGTNKIYIGANTSNANYNAISLNSNNADSARIGMTGGGSGDNALYLDANTNINFRPSGSSTIAVAMLSGGNVLIGATSQAAAARASVQTATDNSRFMGFQSAAGAEIGYIFNNTTATQYSTSSDYRLKENIAPMIGALAKVAALKPVTYKWKADGSDGQGFIAHELQEVVPDCVTGDKDATWEQEYEVTPAVPAVVDEDGVEVTPAVEAVKGTRTVPSYQGVDTSFLVATLVASIQELKAIIDAQATRIAALENV